MANTLRWSEEQLAAHLRRPPAAAAKPAQAPTVESLTTIIAKGTQRDLGMNKTEAEYADALEARKARGEVVWWRYEAITLKLADNTRYTPDFLVMRPDGELQVHETKGGFIREDGWQKLKIAAGLFPFRFFLCQKRAKKDGGDWLIKEV